MGPVGRLVELIAGTPVELPPQLAEQYPELCRARYRRGGLPLRIGGWSLGTPTVAGITLWRTIWLARGVRWDAELLLHEIRHVHQFQTSAAFPFRYIWESLRRGYRANRFEVDARHYAAVRLARAGAHPSQQDV